MKKLFGVMCCFAALACAGVANAQDAVDDECVWSWWSGAPASNYDKDLRGCALGFGSGFKSVRGAQVSLCMNTVKEFKSGCQFAFGYNRADTLRNGCQLAFVNNADSAALQLGLLCFNKKGFLPFFVFFNFDKHGFGQAK